ncbi:hypothetical protein [Streptomyces sp. 8L]|nr:hypothetical protein [Streptomyces sp. 8L]
MRRVPPALGQDTDEVLSELGLTEGERRRLRRSGAFGPVPPSGRT